MVQHTSASYLLNNRTSHKTKHELMLHVIYKLAAPTVKHTLTFFILKNKSYGSRLRLIYDTECRFHSWRSDVIYMRRPRRVVLICSEPMSMKQNIQMIHIWRVSLSFLPPRGVLLQSAGVSDKERMSHTINQRQSILPYLPKVIIFKFSPTFLKSSAWKWCF